MKKIVLLIILGSGIIMPVWSEGGGMFSLCIDPSFHLPLGKSRDYVTLGGGARLNLDYLFPFSSFFFMRGAIDYSLSPNQAEEERKVLNLLSLGAGIGFRISIIQRLQLKFSGVGGYTISMYDGIVGGNPFILADVNFSYFFRPSIGLGIGTAYKIHFSKGEPLYQGLGFSISITYNFGTSSTRPEIKIKEPEILPVFPVFYKYYDDHSLGQLTIENEHNADIEDIRVSFYVNQYMDKPKECLIIEELGKGEEKQIDLFALFNDSILNITESTKVMADIRIEYTFYNESYTYEHQEIIRLYDRNAMTWDDDNKAASFITPKEPVILGFAKNIAGIVRNEGFSTIDANLRMAMGIFEALSIYGINYVKDPTTPYVEYSKDNSAIDFLQFPKQTMEYKAGDCDDLSILFCALLESIGIETAFITAPGHIYMAFALDVSQEEAEKIFLKPEDFIIYDEKTWIPVEITLVREGFLKAWQIGAKEWRDGQLNGSVSIFPIRSAWEVYEPVGILSGGITAAMVDESRVLQSYIASLDSFITRELQPRVKALLDEINTSGDDPWLRNKLGVLYARYGQYEEAEAQFRIVLSSYDYVPAMVNMGNLLFLKEDYESALEYYNQANDKQPDNPKILVNIIKTNFELENHNSVNELYTRLVRLDSTLADEYEYLVSITEDTLRASSQLNKENVEWNE
jgi:hypothetical protein